MPSKLARTSTVVAKPTTKRYAKSGAPRRKAYKPRNKKKMMIARAPFVETKSRTHEDTRSDFPTLTDRNVFTAYNTQHFHMNPDSFIAMNQGFEETQMIGRAIYAKYLKMKISVRFPQPAFQVAGASMIIPNIPQRYELVWGFVNSTQWTGTTTPNAPNATLTDIHTHINQRVIDYFNEQKDYLRFIPKRASTIQIVGRRKVYPSKKYLQIVNSHDNVSADTLTGVIPDFNTSIKWPMMKKVHYDKTAKMAGGLPGFFPNFNKLPFCVLVNPDWEQLPSSNRILYCPMIAYNDCIWFSDS